MLFEPVFVNCKNEKGFFEQLSSIILCGNLFSKWRKAALKSRFHFCSLGKMAEKAIFLSKIQFFYKRSSLRSQTFLSVSQTCWDTRY